MFYVIAGYARYSSKLRYFTLFQLNVAQCSRTQINCSVGLAAQVKQSRTRKALVRKPECVHVYLFDCSQQYLACYLDRYMGGHIYTQDA